MKILNCITNSFFRTIGRILAYFVIGGLFIALLSKAKLPSLDSIINDTLFMKVNAEQIVVPVNPRSSEYYFGIPNWSSGWTLDGTQNFARTSFWSHNYVQEQWIQFGSDNFTTDVDYLEFTFLANEPYSTTISNTDNYCKEWGITTYTDIPLSNGEHGVLHNVYTCKAYGNNSNDTVYTNTLGNFAMYFEIEYTNGNKPMCTVTGTSIICPTNHLVPYKLHIYTYFNTSHNTAFDFNISRHVRGYYTQNQQQIIDSINNQTNSVINNQNSNTNKTLEELNNTNGTAQDDAENFFGNFQVSDHGGLSGIITAPLNTISNLVNNTCQPLVLPLPFVDDNITLPCMSDIYSQNFGVFFTIYQSLMLALISYRCLRSLFFDVRGFLNPNDGRIEVLDL